MKYTIGIVALIVCFLMGMPLQQHAEAALQSQELSQTQQGESRACKVETLKATDKYGFGIAVVAMGVVFLGLLCLYLVFKVSDSVAFSLSKKRVMKMSGFSKEEARSRAAEPGELFAAIAMALDEISEEDHDDENMVLTMRNVARSYSPWSSKIYTLRELPKR